MKTTPRGCSIAYELREYEVEDEHLDAVTVARKVGLDPSTVFKTLVCRAARTGVCFAVVHAQRLTSRR